MSIAIDKDKCRACGRCEKVCPGTLISADESGKAYIKYPKDCWGCSSCIKECRFGAIALYIGADLGGNGSLMRVENKGDILNWNVTLNDGTVKTIAINKKEANKY